MAHRLSTRPTRNCRRWTSSSNSSLDAYSSRVPCSSRSINSSSRPAPTKAYVNSTLPQTRSTMLRSVVGRHASPCLMVSTLSRHHKWAHHLHRAPNCNPTLHGSPPLTLLRVLHQRTRLHHIKSNSSSSNTSNTNLRSIHNNKRSNVTNTSNSNNNSNKPQMAQRKATMVRTRRCSIPVDEMAHLLTLTLTLTRSLRAGVTCD